MRLAIVADPLDAPAPCLDAARPEERVEDFRIEVINLEVAPVTKALGPTHSCRLSILTSKTNLLIRSDPPGIAI